MSALFGGIFGILTSLYIIACFGEMILCSALNIYFASVFFFVGAFYTYKIIKKNHLQESLEHDSLMNTSASDNSSTGSQNLSSRDINRFDRASTGGSNIRMPPLDNLSMMSDVTTFTNGVGFDAPKKEKKFKCDPLIIKKQQLALALYQ